MEKLLRSQLDNELDQMADPEAILTDHRPLYLNDGKGALPFLHLQPVLLLLCKLNDDPVSCHPALAACLLCRHAWHRVQVSLGLFMLGLECPYAAVRCCGVVGCHLLAFGEVQKVDGWLGRSGRKAGKEGSRGRGGRAKRCLCAC